ncbi:MAG TPA: undecaprenyl-phosphate glucose phosphotransferase [Fibrobacteria bacterium]|nr:undecaprenyl-phosphate glucose phosphotransferase [Fibrobacteria bacterium]
MIQESQNKFAPILRIVESALILGTLVGSCLLVSGSCNENALMVGLAAVVLYLLLAEPSSLYGSWRGAPLKDELLRCTWVWISSSMVLAFILQTFLPGAELPRNLFLVWVGTDLVGLLAWRASFRFLVGRFRNRGRNRARVAIAPADLMGLEVGKTIEAMPDSGLDVAGWFDDRNPEGDREPSVPKDMILGDLEELVARTREGEFQRVYLAFPLSATERTRFLIQRLADTTASVYLVPDFFTFNLVNSRMLHLGNLTAISVFELPYSETDWYVKRTFDILFSLGFLAVFGIPMLAIAAAVKLTSPGPAIFKQKRYGLSGQPIEVWKFRSMRTQDNGPVVKQATKGDPRITPLGAFLRKSSIDEFPQFINVLQGSMSIVGPRPHAIAHNEEYRRKIHGYMLRHKVKPGITGWAQVHGWRGETETLDKMEQRVKYDIDYLRRWSLWLDLKICFLTAWQLVFKRDNVY